ncbi:chitin synthase-domain-containing protein [Gilbertella persicaria]|uniref:chitin synthase-domain-containing protein n=1 Tax=Gilbertella persicaria TaxID=101096 RepID=UPI00221EED2C|nr:chitin synthase-domain-containing protein [Gilbertella persicaria]KAI8078230.1 chitin synthase-domain-containing protein [Gilbertella persicaria]
MSNPNSRQQGYRPDPRLSQQQQYAMRPQSQQPRSGGQQRIQSYGMDQFSRPRPPPHNQQPSSRSRPQQPHQQQPHYQSSRQSRNMYANTAGSTGSGSSGGRQMRSHGAGQPMMPQQQQQGPYRRVSMNRSRSLSRPERQRPKQGMFRSPSQQQRMMMQQPGRYNGPPNAGMRARPNPMPNRLQHQLQQQQRMYQQQEAAMVMQQEQTKQPEKPEEKVKVLTSWWAWMAYLMTCCIPNWFIRICLRKKEPMVQQAWREKLSLVYIICILCGALAFITYGLNKTLCPTAEGNSPFSQVSNGVRVPVYYNDVRVFGSIYKMDDMKNFFATKGLNLTNDYENTDISSIFSGDTNNYCGGFASTQTTCYLVDPYGGGMAAPNNTCLSLAELQSYAKPTGVLGFDWADLNKNLVYGRGLTLVGDSVLNLTTYVTGTSTPYGSDVDQAIRSNLASDLSFALLYTKNGSAARKCLQARYKVGIMETETGGCIADKIIMTLMLVVIIAMIVVRYSMALLFQWFISRRLTKPGGRSNWLAWRSIKGGNDDPANHIPGPYNNYGPMHVQNSSSTSLGSGSSRGTPAFSEQSSAVGLGGAQSDIVTTELYTVLLVTCYSEGEEGLRITMDSLAETTYSKKHKIFFVIADGMITGAGETQSTPDIVVSMMDLDPTMTNPKPASYLAIADGEKQLNMAKVYAGHYKGVPCITIVKSGTEEEADAPKAGNRGKRDSQLILMSFFQRVLFNDRLSELDYEIFWKMTWLMKGVTPDKFELVLMVDADTKVLPDALTYMVAAMANDITIMGLCGETRIANKRTSWVTAIQVFEYYISHHYAKAFESLFGIVTCLPGCFSMYRIKSPKNGAWVPILANPDIILEYNQNVVTTLHEKNLLLLGEDRFLSTLMLRTFPRRQMMFVPQARCKTVVPDEFKVLLSQRRRWINSTVHNLMELVLVSDLCGIACLSMQFSVFVDLIGTLVLPAAIIMTLYLIISSAVTSEPQWQSLALLIAVLFLPAVLIGITTFKLIYILWMLVYIVALPIWNLVLPVYSFWHFDDFSWGATRVVAGAEKDKGHGDAEGKFDPTRLVMKKWEDWETERTGQKFSKKMTLKTPLDSPTAFDGKNTVTPATAPFGTIFNDRKMFSASPAPTISSTTP